MEADHGFRTLHRRGDFVDVERRGVRREDRTLLHDLVELAEDVLLHVHVLEHGLDHEVAIGEIVHVERAGQKPHALLDLFHREAALLRRVLVVLADDAEAPVERVLLRLHNGDGQADIEEVHGDAAAHRAGADDADLVHRNDRRVGRHIRQLPDLAFGEEDMALRRRLRAGDEFAEELLLHLDAFVERQVHRRLDALDVVFGREEAAELAGIGLADIREDFRLAAGRFHLVVQVAHLLQRALLGDDLVGEGNRALAQLAFFREFVDEAHFEALLRAHMLPGRHHFERLFRADDARQALRAARARQKAEVHFRQSAFRRRHRHPVVAGQRHFQAAAQRRAVDRGDDGFRRVLDHGLRVEEARALRRLAEFGDVGARDEGLALADQHDGLHVRVVDRLLDAVGDAFAHRRRKRVHGWRIEGDDGDAAFLLKRGDVVDRCHGAPCLFVLDCWPGL